MLFFQNEPREIRKMFASGMSRTKIAKIYKCSYSVIASIVLNKSYYDEGFEPEILPTLDIAYCRQLREQKMPCSTIAKMEQQHTKRVRPFSGEYIRRKLLKQMVASNG